METFPPEIAIAVWEEFTTYDRTLQERIQEVTCPKVVFMSGVGHNVMIEDPQTFNHLLGETIQELISSRVAH